MIEDKVRKKLAF